ncbi:AimR family lysis-lysogeny pheromone receptor [Bacillus sp. UMB0728]|uniref:AimR family lysis-lysogeny pheromone receptor n=1 Tax=Bacillus sp. UMB0728 TaxID=2066052 RepID=UPI000C78D22B|nr:AimR family lysis-lysogeny pheromone receptor [Bacillus sp. UMB0728]PLR72247.1 hypothetical protein CYJ37_11875 [Bacillus sp. UMB0728]
MEEQKGLRQMLINRLESERGLATKMAKMTSFSSGSSLMKTLRKNDGDIELFDSFVYIVHELFPEEKFDLMFEFAKTLNPNRMTARFMIEYAALYGLREMKVHMINKLLNSDNDHSVDWAYVYNIDHLTMVKELGSFEAINLLSQRKYTSPEMKVYSKIVLYYIFEDMRNIKMMETLYSDIKGEIDNIVNTFTKSSFLARLFLIEGDVNLHNKLTAKVKENIFAIENALDPLKYYAFLTIGNSYMLTNYEKALELYNRCLENVDGVVEEQVRNSKNFLSILWGKFDQYVFNGDLSNELFYYAKNGEIEKGKAVLAQIEVDELSVYQKAFNCYYQALLFDDENMLYKSIKYFNESGDKFYKMLPIRELQVKGINQNIIEVLSA